MVDRLVCLSFPSVQTQGFSSIWIYVKPREVTAGDVDPDAMTFLEDIDRGEGFDLELVDLPGLHELLSLGGVLVPRPKDTIGYVHFIPRGVVFAHYKGAAQYCLTPKPPIYDVFWL